MNEPGLEPGSAKGLAVGLVISMLLASALVISAAQAGITPGVSPLVVLFGWVVFGLTMGPRLKRFLAIAQVTGSAGAAVTAGVVFTAPILQIMFANQGQPVPPVDVPLLIVASLAGSLLGFGFVGLATRRYLSDPRLPAPEAVACDRLIETAVERPEQRPRLLPSLVLGMGLGFVTNALLLLKWMEEEVATLAYRVPLPWRTASSGRPDGFEMELPLPVSPLYLGIGALLTLPTAFLIFCGGFVNATTVGYAAAHAMPPTTFRWVGGAAMTVAVLYSLVVYAIEGRRQRKGISPVHEELDESLLEQSPAIRRMLIASLVGGALLLAGMMAWVGAPALSLVVMGVVALILVFLLSGLGALLSLQVGSSASPVSGTVFMGMLVLSLTALALGMEGTAGVVFLVPIVVAACVAICAANDSSQDYKTMQLNGLRVSDGFKGQLLGLLGGSIVVPLTLWVAHRAYVLGSPDLPSPQASFFATVLESLFLDADIPWAPVGVGAALGLLAVLIETVGRIKGVILSSLAFAVGIYLPSVIGTGILLGALARFAATRRLSLTTHGGILTAAGLITGDAFLSLILGVLIVCQVDTGTWGPDALLSDTEAGWMLPGGVGQAFLAALVLLIFLNYRRRNARS